MKSEIHKLLYRLVEIMLQQEQHVLPVDLLFDDAQIGEFVKGIQIDSPYQQLLLEGVLTESVREEKLYVSFSVEGYFHYVLGEVIHNQSEGKDINYFLSLFQNKLKGVAEGVENCLIRDVQVGISSRLIDLIDAGGSALDVCVTPLASYFLFAPIRRREEEDTQKSHVSQVIDQLFSNPSDNDIEVLEKAIVKLENAQKNELRSLIYREVNEKIAPDNLKKALLYVKSIKHLDKGIRKSKLNTLPEFGIFEETETYGTYLSAIAHQFDSIAEFDKAIVNYEKALAIRIKIHGNQHPKTGTVFNSIGVTFFGKGEFDKAIENIQKSLAIRIKTYGEEHPQTAIAYNNLGGAWNQKGEYDKAIEFIQKALAIRIKVNGGQHPQTGITLNNLGFVFSAKGEYDKAIDFYEKALVIRIKVYGENHPNSGVLFNNLGGTYSKKGQYNKAIAYLEKALIIRVKVHGEQHPQTGTTYKNLGLAYSGKEEYDKAIDLFNKSLTIYLSVHDENHQSVGTLYTYLAEALKNKGEFDKAIEFYEKALVVQLKVFGTNHAQTGTTYSNLGVCYGNQQDNKLAKEFFEKAYSIFLQNFGEDDAQTKLLEVKLNELNDA